MFDSRTHKKKAMDEYGLQQILGTMQREYGHHETMALGSTLPEIFGIKDGDVAKGLQKLLIRDKLLDITFLNKH